MAWHSGAILPPKGEIVPAKHVDSLTSALASSQILFCIITYSFHHYCSARGPLRIPLGPVDSFLYQFTTVHFQAPRIHHQRRPIDVRSISQQDFPSRDDGLIRRSFIHLPGVAPLITSSCAKKGFSVALLDDGEPGLCIINDTHMGLALRLSIRDGPIEHARFVHFHLADLI